MPSLVATKDELILGAPDVIRPTPVASQPEFAFDPPKVEAFGNIVIFRQW